MLGAIASREGSESELPIALRLVALMRSLLGKGDTTDFQVRPWGIRLGSPPYHEINSPSNEGTTVKARPASKGGW